MMTEDPASGGSDGGGPEDGFRQGLLSLIPHHVSDLERALYRLPEDRREALLLVGAGGFSYEEAAQVCGVPAGTIKSRVARGRAQLMGMLAEEGQAPSR